MQSKNLLLSIIILIMITSFSLISSVGASSVMWDQVYGGSGTDCAYSVIETSDGGFAVAGCTDSFGAGGTDFLLIKTDMYGKTQWNKTYGGIGYDCAHCLVETSDKGFAITGVTDSFGSGGNDFWLIKTDGFGNIEWNQTYGGPDSSIAYVVIETSDGGFAIAGSSGSPLYFPIGSGFTDFWLVKTDTYGNMEWNQTYGGPEDEVAHSLVETGDGGFALAGLTESNGESGNFWLIKTDKSGNMEWNQTYRSKSKYDRDFSLVMTSDGGFALASINFWLIKTDSFGNMEWNQTYGKEDYDIAYALTETADDGFAIAGETYSTEKGNGFWLVKTDAQGNMDWNQTYQRTEYDYLYSVVQTSDGGYVLAGDTTYLGSSYVWLVKTDKNGIVPEFSSLFIALMIIAATLVITKYKTKLTKTTNHHS